MAKSESKQKVGEALADLSKFKADQKVKKDTKLTTAIAGKNKTIKIKQRDENIMSEAEIIEDIKNEVADKMAIIQAYEDELAGDNLKKGYKKPKKAGYMEQATLMALEYTDVNRSGSN